MTDTLTRRTLVKGAAWSVPVIALAVSTPQAAASAVPAAPLPSRLTFTNTTATQGKAANTIYVKTKVMVTDGKPVEGVTLVIALSRGAQTWTKTWPMLAAYGNTGPVDLEFPGIPKGEPVTVSFIALAPGVRQIDASKEVETPRWWS